MGVSDAVQWWEEWQLRMLVLASLVIQYTLCITSNMRKFPIRSWIRPIIWVAYLGSDAIAIYALAILFNRQKKHQEDGHGVLEVLWAPVLLIHLGGQDSITAYNIEDNELWTRHILTAVSQVTVAVYVFWKSWRGSSGDQNLLVAAILLFIPGILKCFEKPWALKKASINALVSFPDALGNKSSVPTIMRSINSHKLKKDPLEEFICKATTGAAPKQGLKSNPNKLLVDLTSPSCNDRLWMLKYMSSLGEEKVCSDLRLFLVNCFHFLYTKTQAKLDDLMIGSIFYSVMGLSRLLIFAAIGLFHHSHQEAYSDPDVKVTYALLCCTAILEFFAPLVMAMLYIRGDGGVVSQYNLMGFLVRNKKNSKMMKIVGVLGCNDFLHQRWRMRSSPSSSKITILVLRYLKDGWENHITDVSSYWKFNDNRGQGVLEREGLYQKLGWSLDGAFDESVLLWHLATDFCFYNGAQHSSVDERAARCREMSNYMMYLLFLNPEMLMAGTRRYLFTAAHEELKGIIVEGDKLEEGELTRSIIAAVAGGGGFPEPADDDSQQQGGIVRDARTIFKVLSGLPEDKMWTVIEGVWVEMLCFSAARCRGYLHAKGLGTGVECLTYVWLLMYYMGMETLAAKLQRADHHHHHRPSGGEHGDDTSSSHAGTGATGQEQAAGPSRSSVRGADKEHVASYEGSDATGEEIV